MQFRYRGFTIIVRDTHGYVRALVLDPVNPVRHWSLPAGDRDEAVEAACAHVDRVCAAEVERALRPSEE